MITDHRKTHTELDNAISSATQALVAAGSTATQVAAPGVGRKIVVTGISAVDTSGAANTLALLSASTNKGNLLLPASGGQVFLNAPVYCAENEAFRITSTGAAVGLVSYSILPI